MVPEVKALHVTKRAVVLSLSLPIAFDEYYFTMQQSDHIHCETISVCQPYTLYNIAAARVGVL